MAGSRGMVMGTAALVGTLETVILYLLFSVLLLPKKAWLGGRGGTVPPEGFYGATGILLKKGGEQ